MDGITSRLTRALRRTGHARVDAVTGLPIFRQPERELEIEFAYHRRHGQMLTLLVVGVDHVAALRGQHGPAAGDAVLREIGRVLTGVLPGETLVARHGTDAFIAVVRDTGAEHAGILAERLRRVVEQRVFRLQDGALLRSSVSIGVANAGEVLTARELFEQAMGARRRAEQTGNAVVRLTIDPTPTDPSEIATPGAAARPGAPPSWQAPLVLWATIGAGLVVAAWCLLEIARQSAWLVVLPFVVLAVLAERLTVQVVEVNRQRISLSFTVAVTMAALTVLPASAPLVSLAAALMHVVSRRQRQLEKALFNLTNPVVAAAVAGLTYLLLRPPGATVTVWHLLAALAAVLAFYLTNIGLITLMISFYTGRPLARVAREASWFGPTNVMLGLTGAFLGEAYADLGPIGVLMFVVPLLVMRLTLVIYVRQSQQTIRELEAARAAAEAAVRAREEFLSIASHELRTPLTTVKGYVQILTRMLRQPALDPEQVGRYVGHLQGQVSRLEALVADLLDSSRIQQGRLDLQPEPLDLAALARQVVARFEHAPELTPAHRLVLDASGPVMGAWDAARLDQVVTNLVSNAVKYSPAGGTIRVSVASVAGNAELSVGDEGVGIPLAEQATLFQPFARGSATTQNVPGAGLGLYITAQIVAAHGGRIDLRSQPGVGSTFTVHLPLAPPA